MAQVKDKVVTVESLKALHDYNQKVYMPISESDELVKVTDIIPISNGGTNADNGADGLKNLFASGQTILSSNQYGDELPTAGTVGRIFFKRLVE